MPFAPTDVAGCRLWLRGDSLALADGAAVATWADGSGNANNLTQGTALNRPTCKASSVNGLPAVRFGGAQWLNAPNLFSGMTAASVYFALKVDSESHLGGLHSLGNGGAGQWYPWSTGIFEEFGTTARKFTADPVPSLASYRIYNVDSAASSYQTRLDGTQLYTTSTNTVGFRTTNLFLGRNIEGGGAASAGGSLVGEVAEVLVYDSVLSTANRQSVEGYLAHRYGLQGNLPVGHPYLSSPPGESASALALILAQHYGG